MSNQIECERCNHLIQYEDSAPKFCSECGGSLTGSYRSHIESDETITRDTSLSDSTNDVTLPPDRTGPVTKAHIEKFDLESVGPYRLIRKLGQGGMGTVFEAQHLESGRNVALKLLSPEVRGTDEMVQRFRRESQIAASINHPRSTFVYESGEHDGQLYITMELMDGGTLKDIVADEGPLPVGRAVDYVLDIIDGLLVAHNAGIVHRDLKPSNSFVDRDGRIKVGDFGLAKSFLGDSSLTQTGTFMGTPQYAAPEQIRNADVDERTDIYALGGTLFYLLTGRAPFVGNAAQVISSIASDTPPKINEIEKGIPRPLVKLVAQTLEKNPERRPFNLNVVRDGLLPYSTRGAMAAEPGRRMGAFYIDTIVMAFLAMFFFTAINPLLMLAMSSFNLNLNPQLTAVGLYLMGSILYYSICEARWGRTIGKWLFGLRVVDKNSESPSYLSALVRALFIPGLLILIDQTVSIYFMSSADITDPFDIMAVSFKSQSSRILVWATIFGLISTARKENGYQTFYDWLSGTKIVRLSGNLETKLLNNAAITVPIAIQNTEKIGGYPIHAAYQENANGMKTYLGRDDSLDRQVWLFSGFKENPISENRRHLTRSSRLRIINQSSDESGHWYSTENVPGIPFVEVIKSKACQWKSICPLFRDIAYELALSEETDLLPDRLTVEHFWLDHTGRIRILDDLLIQSRSPENTNDSSKSKLSSSVDAVVDLFHTHMSAQEHPVELMELTHQLKTRRDQGNVFDWLFTELNETIERQSSWNWIDRAGMLAISFGIEFSLMSTLLFVASFLLSGWGPILQAVITMAAGLLIAGLYGYFADGGPAMKLSNVSLRNNRDKSRVSRWKATIRSVLAWTPVVVLLVLTFLAGFLAIRGVTTAEIMEPTLIVPLIILSVMSMFLTFGGALFAILNPSRSIPDYLVSTRLMRK